jgi:hypothetical protein
MSCLIGIPRAIKAGSPGEVRPARPPPLRDVCTTVARDVARDVLRNFIPAEAGLPHAPPCALPP